MYLTGAISHTDNILLQVFLLQPNDVTISAIASLSVAISDALRADVIVPASGVLDVAIETRQSQPLDRRVVAFRSDLARSDLCRVKVAQDAVWPRVGRLKSDVITPTGSDGACLLPQWSARKGRNGTATRWLASCATSVTMPTQVCVCLARLDTLRCGQVHGICKLARHRRRLTSSEIVSPSKQV